MKTNKSAMSSLDMLKFLINQSSFYLQMETIKVSMIFAVMLDYSSSS